MFSLICGVAAVSMAFAIFQVQAGMRALSDEVQRQAMILAESQRSSVERIFQTGSHGELQALVDQYRNHQHLAGMAIYDDTGATLAITSSVASSVEATPAAVVAAIRTGRGRGEYFHSRGKRMHIFASPLSQDGRTIGAIAVFHDVAFIAAPVWRHALTGMAQTLLIVGFTLLIVHWSLREAPPPHGRVVARFAYRGHIRGWQAAQGKDFSIPNRRIDRARHQLAGGARGCRRGGAPPRRGALPLDR